MAQLTFLGTSCMVPTKERNVQGIFLKYKGEGILVDCGEGTQRQMNIAGINRNSVTRILISHWHGDHVSGLLGLLQTMGNANTSQSITLYGPRGSKKRINYLLQSIDYDVKIDLRVEEIDPDGMAEVFETPDFAVSAAALDHAVPCLGFRFREKDKRRINLAQTKKLGIPEGPLLGKLQKGHTVVHKGKKIDPDDVSTIQQGKVLAFILDTVITNACYALAQDADILISEAAYTSDLEEKANKHKHMTAKQAALVANKAGVKKLVLTHVSQRYKTPKPILDDAKEVFPHVEVAYDFMKLAL